MPKDRSDNMHIQEAARQGPPQGDIEVAKEKIDPVHEVWMIVILSLCLIANFNSVQENAVGYKEYREGLHMEITAKGVSPSSFYHSSSNALTISRTPKSGGRLTWLFSRSSSSPRRCNSWIKRL
jgi:hypothetical protein